MYRPDLSVSLFEVLYLVLVLITLLVGVLTLRAVRTYVSDTAAIAHATRDQAESAWTPCLVLELPIGRIWIPQGKQIVTDGQVFLKNLGNGPALNVRCDIVSAPDATPVEAIDVPHLAIGESTADHESEGPDRAKFGWPTLTVHATYLSVTGRRYETNATIAAGEGGNQYHLRFGPATNGVTSP